MYLLLRRIASIFSRIPPRTLLILGIIAAIMALFGENPYVSVCVCIMTMLVIVAQYFQGKTYTHDFASDDWFNRSAGEFGLTIPRSSHAKGKAPQLMIYEKQLNDRYSLVECGVETSKEGDVIIVASQPINGQVRIR